MVDTENGFHIKFKSKKVLCTQKMVLIQIRDSQKMFFTPKKPLASSWGFNCEIPAICEGTNQGPCAWTVSVSAAGSGQAFSWPQMQKIPEIPEVKILPVNSKSVLSLCFHPPQNLLVNVS